MKNLFEDDARTRDILEEVRFRAHLEQQRQYKTAVERHRRDDAWQRELLARADGKPVWLWVREYEV